MTTTPDQLAVDLTSADTTVVGADVDIGTEHGEMFTRSPVDRDPVIRGPAV